MLGFFKEALSNSLTNTDFRQKVEFFAINGCKDSVSEKEYRKAIKVSYKKSYASKVYIKQFEKLIEHKSLINFGKVYPRLQDGGKDYDSWKDWYLIEVPSDEEEEMKIQAFIFLKHYLEGVVEFGREEINLPYDCSGQTFSGAMEFIRVGENRILAVKQYNIDV